MDSTTPQPTVNAVPTTQPVPQASPTTQPVAPKPKNKFPILKILGFVVFMLLILFVATGIVFKDQIANIVSPTPTPTPKIAVSPTPIPTDKWQTYTNNEYKFSFKYPNGFVDLIPNFRGDILAFNHAKASDLYRLNILKNSDKLEIKDYFKNVQVQLEKEYFYARSPVTLFDGSEKTIKLPNDINGYYFKNANCTLSCDQYYWKNDIYIFNFINNHNDIPEQDEIFSQIISSFSFTALSTGAATQEN